ncbi:MAG: hypothetical protein JW993_03730 [Sedimentisphaerales bacterium]|nr:hypothetical protein [Sedimentisphaerales bacterium]
MRKDLLVFGLVLAALGMGGCISIHSEEERIPPRPPMRGDTDATIQEIDAVGKLDFDNNRHAAYRNIARREGLSDRAQVHLVDAVFKRLSFENMKVDVLLTLIENPCFSPAAKGAILSRLDSLAFENNKLQILQAIDKRHV